MIKIKALMWRIFFDLMLYRALMIKIKALMWRIFSDLMLYRALTSSTWEGAS